MDLAASAPLATNPVGEGAGAAAGDVVAEAEAEEEDVATQPPTPIVELTFLTPLAPCHRMKWDSLVKKGDVCFTISEGTKTKAEAMGIGEVVAEAETKAVKPHLKTWHLASQPWKHKLGAVMLLPR